LAPDAASGPAGVDTSKRHGAAACVRSVGWFSTTIAPWRVMGSAFAPTRNETVPSPCPVAVDVI
jgi:hypothetical protein